MGGPAAFVNAVMDALGETGVRNIDMPLLPDRVWEALTYRPGRVRLPAGAPGLAMMPPASASARLLHAIAQLRSRSATGLHERCLGSAS